MDTATQRQIPAFGDPSLAFLSGLRLLAAFLVIRLVWLAQEATGPAVLRALALMVHPYPDVDADSSLGTERAG